MTRVIHAALHAWVGLLALDAALRLLNGLLFALLGNGPLGLLIGPVELILLPVALVLWIGAAITPRIPLRVLLPGWITFLWLGLGALPISILFYNRPGLSLCTGLAMAIAAAATVFLGRTLGGDAPFLDAAALDARPELRWQRSVGFIGANLTLLPAAIALYVVSGAAWALHWGTGGFMTLTPGGVAATHRVYTNGPDTAHLIGMVHIGDEEAYPTLFSELPQGEGTLILAEGVQDSDKLMTAPGDAYGQAAKRIGLSAQKPMEQLTTLRVRNADVDVNTFDPLTIELLNVVLGLYGSDGDREEAIQAYLGFWLEHSSDSNQVAEQLFEDILYARNQHLLAEIDKAREEVDHIVVPWGALHLREVSETLEAQGWTYEHQRKVVLIPFG